MLFNSISYLIFLPLVLLLYYRLPHRWQNRLLLVASYIFYGAWDVRFLTLIWLSTAVDFSAGRLIHRARAAGDQRRARLGLLASLVTNLGLLAFFKYFNFFTDSFAGLLNAAGINVSWPLLNIILPVGISFYTFQTLSYTIDIYRGKLEPTRDPLNFALFVAFFPQLVAGPIERATALLPQLERPRVVTQSHWQRGLYLILVGLIRKVVIADTAGAVADRFFADPASGSSLQLAAALILYSIQIYGDFAGYSNIARGSAQLLGIDLMRNFHHPYFAANFSEFWRRWHISLSTWLRDYLYIPLGGSRRGPGRNLANLMVTMLLCGLWHGASWNFVIWGGLHGIYLVLRRLWGQYWPAGRLMTPVNIGLTFTVATLTWLPFRLTDFDSVALFLRRMVTAPVDGELILIPLVILVAFILALDLPQALSEDEFVFLRIRPLPGTALASLALLLIVFTTGSEAPFIYFQF